MPRYQRGVGVVRLKNLTTGEVKLLPLEAALKYRRYGWVDASLMEWRQYLLRDRKHDTAGGAKEE